MGCTSHTFLPLPEARTTTARPFPCLIHDMRAQANAFPSGRPGKHPILLLAVRPWRVEYGILA